MERVPYTRLRKACAHVSANSERYDPRPVHEVKPVWNPSGENDVLVEIRFVGGGARVVVP